MEASNITNGIPPEILALIEGKLKECRDAIAPYVVPMTPDERKKAYKVSDGTEPFVDKGVGYTQRFPQFVPQQMNVANMLVLFGMMTGLTPIVQMTTDLLTVLSDTKMAAGCGTLQEVLRYYNSTKQAAKENTPSAKDIYNDMSKRYERKKKEEAKSEDGTKKKAKKTKTTDKKDDSKQNIEAAS